MNKEPLLSDSDIGARNEGYDAWSAGAMFSRNFYEALRSSGDLFTKEEVRAMLREEVKSLCPLCEKGRMPTQHPAGFFHDDATNEEGCWPYQCRSSITHEVAARHNIIL